MPDTETRPESSQWAIHLGGYGLGVLATGIGGALLVQGDARLLAPAWKVALKLPVGTNFWAWWLIVCGAAILAAMLIGRGRVLVVTASLAASFALWARCVAGILALDDPTASWIGPQLWGGYALMFLVHGLLHLPAFRR